MGAAALAVATGAQAQELKVGTVDLNKIFDAYYKTAEAKQRVAEQENAYKKERQAKMDDYQKLGEELNKLREEATNGALAPEVREQKKKALEAKVSDLQMRQREIVQFDNQRRGEIQTAMVRMRGGIVEEITKVVKEQAARRGLTLVFDKTGQSAALAPIVVFAQDAMDFSDDVIKTVNATKPAGAAK